jgi:hypothetical protein
MLDVVYEFLGQPSRHKGPESNLFEASDILTVEFARGKEQGCGIVEKEHGAFDPCVRAKVHTPPMIKNCCCATSSSPDPYQLYPKRFDNKNNDVALLR